MLESAEEVKLAKASWWRVWHAWTLHQIWVAWTRMVFGGRQYLSSVSLAQVTWVKKVQALHARWQLVPIDPVKGPPKLPGDINKVGMASQETERVIWHYQLPAGLRNAIKRRQPRQEATVGDGSTREAHAQ